MSTTSAISLIKTISASLKLVDTKKENLKKAFEDLQAHSSRLSSFPLNWPDLDSHFASTHASLTRRLLLLESLEADQPHPASINEQSSSAPSEQPACHDRIDSVPESGQARTEFKFPKILQNDPSSSHGPCLGESAGKVIPARPELKVFCEKMDGKGLRRYIGELSNERTQIKSELPDAIRSAPDPAALVLDAIEGFHLWINADWDSELGVWRRICELLLDVLVDTKQSCSVEVRERAKKLALDWKGKVDTNEDIISLSMGVLLLVAAYQLISYFDMDELVDYLFHVSARHRRTIELIRSIGLENKVPDLIEKVLGQGKQLLAVKFVLEFNLKDKFPLVPLLKTHIKETKKAAKKVRTEGNNSPKSLNEATAKEVSALRAIIKIIEEHKLDSEYPKGELKNQIEQLEKEKADRKRSASTTSAAKPQHRNGSKRPRTTTSVGPAAFPMNVDCSNSTISSYQRSHLLPLGLLPEHPAPYLSSAAGPYGSAGSTHYAVSSGGPYGLVVSTHAAAPYAASSAGLGRGPIGLSPSGSRLYPSDPHLSSHYGRTAPYGMPTLYHPSYYPQ